MYFDFEHGEQEAYLENVKDVLKKNPDLFKKHKRFGLPRDWVPLHQYKNKYYLYAPSDWGGVGKRMINDSVFVYWYMDGPMPFPIQSLTKLSETRFKINMSDPYGIQNPQVFIHIIDPKTNLAVFEYGKGDYQLYIPAENAMKYDIIVNYCLTQKMVEFKFDEIDYKKLLGK